MKKILISFFCIILIISSFNIVISANNQEQNSDKILNTSYNWVVMIYLNGDNLLYSVQQNNLNQIKDITSSEEVKIVILHDSNSDGDTKLYYIEDNNLIEQEWPSESNMVDPNTIVDFVQKVKNDIIAQHYALFISTNRGSGWQGILWDDTNGDDKQITMPELYSVFDEITNGGSDKLDILGIETCMGMMTEIAYQLSSFVDYYIAFEDCATAGNPPYCWPYVEPITDLVNDPFMTSEEFSESFANYFEPRNFPMSRIITVLTVTDLSKINSIVNSLDDLADFFIENIEDYRDEIHEAIEDTRVLGRLWYIEFYLDPVQFLELLSINDPEYEDLKNEIITRYNNAVVACAHLEDDPVCGLSLYIPWRKVDYNRSFRFDELLSSYEETLFAEDTNWDEFLKVFLDLEGNTPPDAPSISGQNRGAPETEYEYTISTNDLDNDEIYYYIDWGDETTSGWLGPYQPGEEIIVEHIWFEQGTYSVRVKAKDSDVSEWGTLTVRMPKNIFYDNLSSWAILIGKISDIEKDPNQRFRFLPIKMLEVSYNPEDRFSIKILDENYGGYPCCGFIDPNEFKGYIANSIICGLWKI